MPGMWSMNISELMAGLRDIVAFTRFCWPDVTLYDKQRDVLYSMEENDETVVPAGNKAGKDFLTGLKVVHTALTRHPVRIMTTSVDGDQLENVLWGEMNWFLQNSKIPLTSDKGGPLLCNHLHWRKVVNGHLCPTSYVVGKVAKKGEGMLGHHVKDIYGDGIPRAFAFMDEASGIDDLTYTMCATWADRIGIIGNPFPCHTFFKRFVEEGDIWRLNGKPGYIRKIIQISAMDTPNVKYGLAEIKAGLTPSNTIILPGVLTYAQYEKRRATQPPDVQCVSLDGMFWAGGDVMLFPSESIKRAKELGVGLRDRKNAKAMGIDPAEGGDKSTWCIGDEKGVTRLVSLSTPDTSVIPGKTIELGRQYNIPPENWIFDQGFGKAHCDLLNSQGYPCRMIAFGAAVTGELRRGVKPMVERREVRDDRTAYKNRRAEMYGDLSYYMSKLHPHGFGIPTEYVELYRQLSLIPRLTDNEGKLKMLPKKKDPTKPQEKSLTQLLGRSPDEADACVLMLHGCLHRARVGFAGAVR